MAALSNKLSLAQEETEFAAHLAKKLGLAQMTMKTLNDVRENLGSSFMSNLGNRLGLS